MRAPTCFRWVHFRNVGVVFIAENHHYSPYGSPPVSRQSIDNIPISGKRVIIAVCNSMHPPWSSIMVRLCPLRLAPLTFSFDAWRFLDSWLHPRATYRIYAWQRRPLSRPSSRCPWSSAWQLSFDAVDYPSKRRINTSPSRVWAERRCFWAWSLPVLCKS